MEPDPRTEQYMRLVDSMRKHQEVKRKRGDFKKKE